MTPISAKVITPATARLLSLATIRQQCEVVVTDTDSDGVQSHPDDALLLGLLDAATDYAEKFTGRSLLLRTYEFALDEFPVTTPAPRMLQPAIEIPYPPLIEVIRFAMGDDSENELEETVDFRIDTYGDKARLRPVLWWPTTLEPAPNVITCRYRAGYQSEDDPDSDAPELPGSIMAAVLIVVEDLYRNRGTLSPEAQNGAEALLRPHRVLLGMA